MARKSVHVTASGVITTSVACKVLAVYGLGGAGVGTVILKDGGSGGTGKHTLDVAQAAKFDHAVKGGGLAFSTDCYATLGGSTAPAGITVEYEDYT